MVKLLLIDLISLLPLIFIGGTNALQWIFITLICGGIGLCITAPHVRSAFVMARMNLIDIQNIKTTAFHTLVALASILLILPGLLSDLIAFLVLVIPLLVRRSLRRQARAMRDQPYDEYSQQNDKKQANARVIEAEFSSDDNKNNT